MQYHEFLRKSGATSEDVSLFDYERYIEKAYMERDDIFPDQEAVIGWYKAAGLGGFSKFALQKLDALRQAIGEVRRNLPAISDEMLDLAARTAPGF